MSDESQNPKSGGSCLGKLLVLIVMLGGIGICIACYFIAQPQDMDDIGGRTPSHDAPPARDIRSVLQNSMDRGYPVTLTETELNQWLATTVKMHQGGELAKQVSLDHLWVRLDDGVAELIMERRIMGHPFTVSIFLAIEKFEGPKGVETRANLHAGPYHEKIPFPMRGGKFGQLVVPQGFLMLVLPGFEKLPAVFHEEIELGISRMARVKIEKNRLLLDPREHTEINNDPASSF